MARRKTMLPITDTEPRKPKKPPPPGAHGYVKPIPKKPANARQAAAIRNARLLELAEQQRERDLADPAAAKRRKAREARELARQQALAQPLPRVMYIPVQADEICTRLSEGENLQTILKSIGLSFGSMCEWLRRHKDFQIAYNTARENQAHLFISQIIHLADGAKGKGELEKIQIETRKWLASKVLAPLYGDKLVHAGDATNPIVTKLVSDSKELLEKIRGGEL